MTEVTSLLEFVRRSPVAPWQDGEKIPWDDPGFSRRMFKEHFSQRHDRASRRLDTIEAHVDWIHEHALQAQPSKVLDLGCGPGLYTSRLARKGHSCVGIDFSPASIGHAADEASRGRLACDYVQEDIREADYGEGFALVMLISGEFNAFRSTDAKSILQRANAALVECGVLLLEPHPYDAVRKIGMGGPSWYSADAGLFSDRPHLCLQEQAWDADTSTATARYFIVDAATGEVSRYAGSSQAYTDDEYRALLEECAFAEIEFLQSLTGAKDEAQHDLMVIVARKRAAES